MNGRDLRRDRRSLGETAGGLSEAGDEDGKGARPLGTAVFFGMIGVTFFGLFLTPVFYFVIRWVTIVVFRRPARVARHGAGGGAVNGE